METYEIEQRFWDSHERGGTPWRWPIGTEADDYAFSLLLRNGLNNKQALDFGCGAGSASFRLAEQGAKVWGFDLSLEMLKRAKKGAEEKMVNLYLVQMPAEFLALRDSCFDLIFGWAILHHTVLPLALSEIYRVLKPGGRAVFIEALGHNPLLNLYRKLTPQLRTPMEKPLTFNELEEKLPPFSYFDHREFYLFSAPLFFFANVVGSKRLYHLIKESVIPLETRLIDILPMLRRYCWMTVINLVK